MTTKFNIKKAEFEDIPSIIELVKELALYEKAPQEVTITKEIFEKTGFGENPIWFGWVAEMNDEIVGMAICYQRFSTWKGPRLYLEDIYVKENLRGNNIGKYLFDTVLDFGKSNHFSGMMWQVLDWNEPAINFYKKYDNVNFDPEWLNCNINFK